MDVFRWNWKPRWSHDDVHVYEHMLIRDAWTKLPRWIRCSSWSRPWKLHVLVPLHSCLNCLPYLAKTYHSSVIPQLICASTCIRTQGTHTHTYWKASCLDAVKSCRHGTSAPPYLQTCACKYMKTYVERHVDTPRHLTNRHVDKCIGT